MFAHIFYKKTNTHTHSGRYKSGNKQHTQQVTGNTTNTQNKRTMEALICAMNNRRKGGKGRRKGRREEKEEGHRGG